MNRMLGQLPDISIQNGTQISNALPYYVLGDCETFDLAMSGGDTTKTYQIQTSNDNVAWYNWTDGTSNIVAPAALNTKSTYGNPTAQFFRIVASAGVTGLTTWKMTKSFYG